MKSTKLIQRLGSPVGTIRFNAFIGLSENTEYTLKSVCDFDYMGNEQFQSGAVPDAISRIVQYCEEREGIKGDVQIVERTILYLCRKDHEEYVVATITKLADDEREHFLLEEPSYFKKSLDGKRPNKGWLEMNNDFMFFIDLEMAQKFYFLLELN